MLYYLFDYLKQFEIPGSGVFQYISFRSGMAVILALLISTFIGKKIIQLLQKQQIGEIVRDLGLEGQLSKKGTPTMGGIIIILALLIPTLLLTRLDNIYIILIIISVLWLGVIGFLDDYIKVFKKNKEGLAGRFKIIGQIGLGLIIGLTLYFHDDIVVREIVPGKSVVVETNDNKMVERPMTHIVKAPITTVPFLKENRLNYDSLICFMGESAKSWGWLVYVLIVTFIIVAVSNGANMTDGLDGLATGTSAIIGTTLGIFAYLSGNIMYADYLNILYIPHSEELVVFMSAFIGATVGFLWFNAFPAQVFMGDTGSLTLGGIIAVVAIMIRIELLIPILCGIFLVENLSVLMQVYYFKYTKYKYGEGRRIFKMAPLHHHFQKEGYVESKIVIRFWIVGIILAVMTFVTLKIR